MSDLTVSEAFAQYGAKLVNRQWAASSISDNGTLVMVCWSHYFKTPEKGLLRYSDALTRCADNSAGNDLLRQHLTDAFKDNTPIRIVFATTPDTQVIDSGFDLSRVKKKFHVRKDIKGQIASFDGDKFVIDFKRESVWPATSESGSASPAQSRKVAK